MKQLRQGYSNSKLPDPLFFVILREVAESTFSVSLRLCIFRKLFAAAEIAKFTPEEAMAYEDSLKVYRDLKNSLDTAREEGKIEVALNMLLDGLTIESIIKYTGLTPEQIEKLRKDSNSVKEPAAPYSTVIASVAKQSHRAKRPPARPKK